MTSMPRRTVLAAVSTAAVVPLAASSGAVSAARVLRRMDGGLPDSFPAHDPDAVRAVVGKSHSDVEAVQDMVTARPELAKAAWDWGFGDWESAIGAASHVGRREIVAVLMEHGARPTHFTFAMLGQVDVVRAICVANPGIQSVLGPHGITLMRHARAGREEAASVVEYLQELGGADEGPTSLPLSAEAAGVYLGQYRSVDAPDVTFTVGFHERRSVLTFQRDDRQFRFLNFLGDHAFSPGGAASVRIEFAVAGDAASVLRVRDGGLALTASRLSG